MGGTARRGSLFRSGAAAPESEKGNAIPTRMGNESANCGIITDNPKSLSQLQIQRRSTTDPRDKCLSAG